MSTMAAPLRKADPPPTDRVPPHDLDAEMSLLGSMMLSREAIGAILPIIPAHDAQRFYQPAHQELFTVLCDLYDQNKPIDLVVAKDELLRRNGMDKVGGEAYMIDLVQSVGSWVNAEHYARIVRDKSMLRDLISCAGHIINDAYDSADHARDVLDRAEQSLFKTTEQRVSGEAASLKETITEVFHLIETRGEHFLSGLPSGFIELDELTSGFQPGELIIIAARPSMGKTALGLNIAERIAVDEKMPVVFFSMEMSRQQIAQRILCARGRVDSHKMRRGMLSEDEIAQLAYVCQDLEQAPLLIDDTPGMSVQELRAKTRRLHLKHDVRCVFIDYLQLMFAPNVDRKLANRQEEIATISRSLKALARELNIPVVAMAQLNRASEVREGHRPRMSDLRESGAIEQDADVVMLLHREEYYKPKDASLKGKAELILAKQRNGPTDLLQLHFNVQQTRFDNLSMAPEPYAGVSSSADDLEFP